MLFRLVLMEYTCFCGVVGVFWGAPPPPAPLPPSCPLWYRHESRAYVFPYAKIAQDRVVSEHPMVNCPPSPPITSNRFVRP